MTVASISWSPERVGVVAWIVAMAIVPAPLAARLLLSVPLALVPRLAPALAMAGVGRASAGAVAPAAAWPWLAIGAGALAALALWAPTGSSPAVVLVVPWWLLALGGLFTSVSRIRAERAWAPTVAGLARVMADLFLVVGATAWIVDRSGVPALGFDPVSILLTAVHFSVAGYALMAVAGVMAGRGTLAARGAVVGLSIGMPLTAPGFLLDSAVAGWPGTVVVAGSGLLVAAALARLDRASGRGRAVALVSAGALGVGMVMAVGWSTALVLGVPYVDLETMVRTHGALNLLAMLGAAAVVGADVAAVPAAVRPTSATVGAAVALAIACGPAVAIWVFVSGADREARMVQSIILATLVAPVIAGWAWSRGGPRLGHRARTAVSLAAGTTLIACAAVATVMAIVPMDAGDPISRWVFLFTVGIIFAGWLGLLAALPCAAVWVLVMRRLR